MKQKALLTRPNKSNLSLEVFLNALKTDLKRALTSWGFIVGIFGLAIAAFFGAFGEVLAVYNGELEFVDKGYYMTVAMNGLNSQIVFMALPVLCVLAFSAAFVDDYKSRYLTLYLPRSGVGDYTRGKVAATALSGGLTLCIGVFVTIAVFALLLVPMETPLPEMEEMGGDYMMESDMMGDGGEGFMVFIDLMTRALVFFANGCLWALVGGALASATMSRYMAYTSPFIFCYVLLILSDRYLKDIYMINPREWLNPTLDGFMWGAWGALIFIGEIIIICGFLYAFSIRRRLRHA